MPRLKLGASRPLTYVLSLLLIPLVIVYGPASPASAAVVAVGETATGIAQTPESTFPGGSVYCQVTGYSRLHDTGLYSVRAVVNCDWGFSYSGSYEPSDMRLVVSDASDSERCRFENVGSPIVENEPSETTLTANLHPTNPPDPSCVLASATLTLEAGPSPALPDGESVVIPFGWALGALPVEESSDPSGACDMAVTGSVPGVGAPYPRTFGSQQFIVRDVTVDWVPQPREDSSIYLQSYVLLQSLTPGSQVQPSTATRVYNASGTANAVSPNGGGLWAMSSWGAYNRSVFAGTTITRQLNAGTTEVAGAGQPETFEVVGVGYTIAAGSGPNMSSSAYFLGGAGSLGVSQQRGIGINDPSLCRFYYGQDVITEPMIGGDPMGPFTNGSPQPYGGSTPVDEGPLTGPDPVSTDDGQCSGFSFTDPSSWAGAGICVLVKAVRALFGVMGDVLQAVLGLVGQLGALLRDLFIPDPSSWDMQRLQDQWDSRPPGSVIQDTTDVLGAAADGLSASGPCELPNWNISGQDAQLACPDETGGPAWQGLMSLVRIAITVAAAFYVFHILRTAISRGGD